jgi:hypothetical protein
MDTDLFTLQGVVIEKDRIGTDLFSIQGIVIEQPNPQVRVAQARMLVAQNVIPLAKLQGVRVLVSQVADGFVTLPFDITGLDNFKTMTARKMTVQPDWNTLTIGKPVANGSGAQTTVTISPTETSAYRVPVQVVYNRRYINVLAALKLVPKDYANVAAVIAAIRAKGILVEDADFDLTKCKVTANTIYLVANKDSYFFVAGSFVSMGSLPTLADVFDVKNLNGFEPA